MKLLLIMPRHRPSATRPWPRFSLAPPMGLASVAAMTPDDIEVEIVDENVQALDLDSGADLVAISTKTFTAPRAYAIARAFRRRGVPVVLGGIHPSLMPDEAGEHADAVCVGEAEAVWPALLADWRAGRLQPVYRRAARPPLEDRPLPRRDLLASGRYLLPWVIETTRGCPQACDFCSVTSFFGHSYRKRPVTDVLAEIRALRGACRGSEPILAIADDNFAADRRRTRSLLEPLAGTGLRWVGQVAMDVADDRPLLDLFRRSGCVGLFIGFESVGPENLAKLRNPAKTLVRLGDRIRAFHDHGLPILGSFILGMDHDDPSVFERTLSFVHRHRIDVLTFSILTPLPGTALYRQMEAEGRLLHRDWERYDWGNVVFRPARMTVHELQRGFEMCFRGATSIRASLRRVHLDKPYALPGVIAGRWFHRHRRYDDIPIHPLQVWLGRLVVPPLAHLTSTGRSGKEIDRGGEIDEISGAAGR